MKVRDNKLTKMGDFKFSVSVNFEYGVWKMVGDMDYGEVK
jgi:hypothetical protein